MMARSKRQAGLHLADRLSQEVERAPLDELLSEVAEDFGDRRALAMEFDQAFARAVARDRKQRIVEFLTGAGNWKPIAITAVVLIVAAVGALFLLHGAARETQWRVADLAERRTLAKLAQPADAELEAVQARFELARSAGDFASAKAAAEQYLSIAQTRHGNGHPMYAKGLYDLAIANENLGNYQLAEPLYLRSIAIAERQLGSEHPGLINALNGLASLYESQARLNEAQSVYWRGISIAEKSLGRSSPDTVGLRVKLAEVEAKLANIGAPIAPRSAQMPTVRSGDLLKVLGGHSGAVERSAFSPDGKRLVTESQGSLRLWDVATGKLTASLPGGRSGLVSLFLADSQIAAGYIDGTLLTWTPGRPLMVESLAPSPGRMLAATADGRRLVGLDGHAFKLLDGVNEVARFEGGAGTIIHAAFAPDGKRVLGLYDDRAIRIWDTATARPLSVLRGISRATWATFSPDGRQVVGLGHGDSAAYLWDTTLGAQTGVLSGHQGAVLHAAFSPDGSRIVTTSNDGTARLWDAQTGKRGKVLKGHEAPVTSATFSPDGRMIATTSQDKTARLWRVLGNEIDVQADSITYASDGRAIMQGSVELHYGLFVLTANEVVHDPQRKTMTASGNVVVRNADYRSIEPDGYILPAEIYDAFERSVAQQGATPR
jgi:tetratricopeptide (TPR) repeat protein